MEITNADFGKRFKLYRISMGFSQTRLSVESGVSRATIWRFENGSVDTKLSSVLNMLDVMGGYAAIININSGID